MFPQKIEKNPHKGLQDGKTFLRINEMHFIKDNVLQNLNEQPITFLRCKFIRITIQKNQFNTRTNHKCQLICHIVPTLPQNVALTMYVFTYIPAIFLLSVLLENVDYSFKFQEILSSTKLYVVEKKLSFKRPLILMFYCSKRVSLNILQLLFDLPYGLNQYCHYKIF